MQERIEVTQVYSVSQYAKLTGQTQQYIRNLCEHGVLDAVQVGGKNGHWRIRSTPPDMVSRAEYNAIFEENQRLKMKLAQIEGLAKAE